MESPVTERPSSPVEFLRARYLEKKKANPLYSLTAFSRDLGVSVSFLSRLLNGERALTVKLAIQIATLLRWNKNEIDALIAQVISTASPQAKISKRFKESFQPKKVRPENSIHFEVERFKAISSWYHLAILNLTFTKNFNSDPSSIAKRLGISKIEAKDAIDRLLDLGLLEQVGKGLKKTTHSIYIKTEKSELALREFQLQMLEKAKAAIHETSQEDFNRRYMPGTTLALDLKKLPAIKEKIKKFQFELAEFAKSTEYDEVYQLNLLLFPLTQTLEGKRK